MTEQPILDSKPLSKESWPNGSVMTEREACLIVLKNAAVKDENEKTNDSFRYPPKMANHATEEKNKRSVFQFVKRRWFKKHCGERMWVWRTVVFDAVSRDVHYSWHTDDVCGKCGHIANHYYY